MAHLISLSDGPVSDHLPLFMMTMITDCSPPDDCYFLTGASPLADHSSLSFHFVVCLVSFSSVTSHS
jgi:hypothetical protein